MWDASVVVAVIGGAVGILGGIGAWLKSSHTARIQAESLLKVEKLRAEAAIAVEQAKLEEQRVSKVLDLAVRQSEPVELELAESWACIQRIKNWIRDETAHSNPVRLAELDVDARRFRALFLELGSKPMDREAFTACHMTTQIAFHVSLIVQKQSSLREDEWDQALRYLVERIPQLTQAQVLIAEARAAALTMSMKRVSQALRSAQAQNEPLALAEGCDSR